MQLYVNIDEIRSCCIYLVPRGVFLNYINLPHSYTEMVLGVLHLILVMLQSLMRLQANKYTMDVIKTTA
jgi:hypothetical protein